MGVRRRLQRRRHQRYPGRQPPRLHVPHLPVQERQGGPDPGEIPVPVFPEHPAVHLLHPDAQRAGHHHPLRKGGAGHLHGHQRNLLHLDQRLCPRGERVPQQQCEMGQAQRVCPGEVLFSLPVHAGLPERPRRPAGDRAGGGGADPADLPPVPPGPQPAANQGDPGTPEHPHP